MRTKTMNNALLDQMNFISKQSVLPYDLPQRQRLFDLWEILMNPFNAYALAQMVIDLTSLEVALKSDLDKAELKPHAEKLGFVLAHLIVVTGGAEMKDAEEDFRHMRKMVDQNKDNLQRLRGEIENAKHALLTALQKRHFLYVHSNFTNHVDQKALFGEPVF